MGINIFVIFVPFNLLLKYMVTACMAKLLLKKVYFFSLLYIRMSGKNINFDDRKFKMWLLQKQKSVSDR